MNLIETLLSMYAYKKLSDPNYCKYVYSVIVTLSPPNYYIIGKCNLKH